MAKRNNSPKTIFSIVILLLSLVVAASLVVRGQQGKGEELRSKAADPCTGKPRETAVNITGSVTAKQADQFSLKPDDTSKVSKTVYVCAGALMRKYDQGAGKRESVTTITYSQLQVGDRVVVDGVYTSRDATRETTILADLVQVESAWLAGERKGQVTAKVAAGSTTTKLTVSGATKRRGKSDTFIVNISTAAPSATPCVSSTGQSVSCSTIVVGKTIGAFGAYSEQSRSFTQIERVVVY